MVLWNCDSQTKKEESPENHNGIENESKTQELDRDTTESGWNYKEVKRNYIDSLMLGICTTQDIEFIDLYPVLDSVASDKYEKLVLVDSLKSIGFKVTNWGRGNWMEGPRIINFTLSNGQCECYVDKLYYSTAEKDKFKVTERIKCNKASSSS